MRASRIPFRIGHRSVQWTHDQPGLFLGATNPEQYFRIAAELAQGLSRLSGLRSILRARMKASPLRDAPRFARNVQIAYRQMWPRWCAE